MRDWGLLEYGHAIIGLAAVCVFAWSLAHVPNALRAPQSVSPAPLAALKKIHAKKEGPRGRRRRSKSREETPYDGRGSRRGSHLACCGATYIDEPQFPLRGLDQWLLPIALMISVMSWCRIDQHDPIGELHGRRRYLQAIRKSGNQLVRNPVWPVRVDKHPLAAACVTSQNRHQDLRPVPIGLIRQECRRLRERPRWRSNSSRR